MNRVLLSILLLVFAASAAWAQPAGKGQGMRGNGQRMQHMQEALGLSQEQVDQIREIRQNGGGRNEVRAVLTEEQLATMEEHRAARQGQGRQGRRGDGSGRGNGPGYGAGQAPETTESSETSEPSESGSD